MQRYTSPRYGRNTDLSPVQSHSPGSSARVNTQVEIKDEMPPGFTYAQPTQINPLPIILLILFTSPYIKREKVSTSSMDNSVDESFEESNTVLDVLSSIYPYMDSEVQDRINFVFGLSETRIVLKNLIDGTYQTPRVLDALNQPDTYQDKAIGIIKSLQPFISLENQTLINRILDVNNTIEKLTTSLRKFQQQNATVMESKGNNLTRIIEIIDIIKILIPAEHQESINQISNILRVVGTVELAQLLNTPKKADTSAKVTSNAIAKGKENSLSKTDRRSVPVNDTAPDNKMSDDKIQDLSNSLKSMLNPEQAKSLDLIMNMAKLLSQDTKETDSAS